MLLQLLMELLGIAPQIVADGEQVFNHLHSAPDAASKAQAIADGIAHINATVAPVLQNVGK